MNKDPNPREGLSVVKRAIAKRAAITALHKKYHALSGACSSASGDVSRADIKRAADAIYYLGGGWPKETSQGRMEMLLDNFVGMYRVLDFIGRGHLVKNHLAVHGISIKMEPHFKVKDKAINFQSLDADFKLTKLCGFTKKSDSLKQLMSDVVGELLELQADICQKADVIRDQLHPEAKKLLGVEDEEFDRIHDMVRIRTVKTAETKLGEKKKTVADSFSNYGKAAALIKHVPKTPKVKSI